MKISEKKRKELIHQLSKEIERRNEIIFSYLHGSFVQSEFFRDIDIAVYVDEKIIPYDKKLEYELELGAELEMNFEVPIDVKVLNRASIAFQYQVTTGRILTSRNDDLRAETAARIWSVYLDYQASSRQFLKDMVSR